MGVYPIMLNGAKPSAGAVVVGDWVQLPGPGSFGRGPCQIYVTGTFGTGASAFIQLQISVAKVNAFQLLDVAGNNANLDLVVAAQALFTVDTNWVWIRSRLATGTMSAVNVWAAF